METPNSNNNTQKPPQNTQKTPPPVNAKPEKPAKEEKPVALKDNKSLHTLVDVIVELNRRGVNLGNAMNNNPEQYVKQVEAFGKSMTAMTAVINGGVQVAQALAQIKIKNKELRMAYKNVDKILNFSAYVTQEITFRLTEQFKKLDIVETKGYTLVTDKDGKTTKTVYADKDGYVLKSLEAVKMTFDLVNSTLTLIKDINEQFGRFKGRTIMRRARKNINMILTFLQTDIHNFIKNSTASLKEIDPQALVAMEKQLSFVKKTFDTIKGLAMSLMVLPPLLIVANLALPMVYGFVMSLTYAMRVMQKGMEGNQLKAISETFSTTTKIVMSVMAVAGLVALGALILPKAFMGMILTTLFVGALAIFIYTLTLIFKITSKLDAATLQLHMSKIGLIVLWIMGVALIATIAPLIMIPALKGLLIVALFTMALIPFVLVLGLFGWAMQLVAPLFMPVLIGIGLIVAVVLALTIIALLLIALEHIKFDKEKVLQSVRDIIEVVTEIITSIFGNPAQHDKPGSEILTLLGLPFKVLNMALQGIGAAAWLILAVFSIAALVLISGLLKLISFDSSTKKTIMDTVQNIVEIVSYIVDNVLYGETKKGEKQDTFADLFGSVGHGLARIVEGLASFGYLVFAMMSIAVILLISKMLSWIEFNQADANDLKERIKGIIDSIHFIQQQMLTINSPSDGNNQNRGLFGSIIEFFSPGLANMIDGLFALGSLVFIFISIALIKGIASFLTTLSSVNIAELDKAKNNAALVMNAARAVMDSLFETKAEPEDSEGGFWGWLKDTGKSLFNFIGGIGDMVEGLLKLGQVAGLMVGIGLISKLGDMLNELGKKANVDSSIQNNVAKLLSTSKFLVKNLLDDESLGSKDTFKKLEAVSKTYDVVGSILQNLNKLNVGSNLDKSISSMKEVNAVIKEMVGLSDRDVANNKKVVDDYVRFLEKVNSADASKLTTTSKIMENWAKLSESISGNFEGLARSMNEHILPALQKLNETMGEVVETLDKGVEQNASIAAMNTNEGMTPENINKASAGNIDAKRAMERAKLAQDYSTATIGDLYDLFATGDARVRIK